MAPPRTKVLEKQVTWETPIEQIWALLSSFGALKAWMPIKSCTVDGHGIGTVRTVMAGGVAASASRAYETLEVLDQEQHLISYKVEFEGGQVPTLYGNWKLESRGEGSTTVTWWIDSKEATEDAIPAIAATFEPFVLEALRGLKKALS
ncbi:hypothetical protein H2204_002225 [Knufia peltigerae]|uniref:SRPBCC family protein n=1 Tax=Knufia peltigerae TaxID=1002370 RepID=A0AA39D0W4_9EURO|nr:hypothetical protein H2204_002225 [Knufia peltigerae]